MKKVFFALASILALTGCGQKNSKDIDLVGTWAIEQAMGVSTEKAENHAFISFDKEGKVNGNASVNLFFGDYELKGEKLTLSNIGMTKMMGASMEVEDAITDAINTTASIKAKGGKVLVMDSKKKTVMILSKEK